LKKLFEKPYPKQLKMGACLCLRLGEHIIDKEDDASFNTIESGPYKWAVINPRPSSARLHRQQQHQIKQPVSQGLLIVDHQHPTNADHSTVYHGSLTCLEILELCSRNINDLDSSPNYFQQKELCWHEKSNEIPLQIAGSPAACISTSEKGEENERSCVDDQPSSSTFCHVFKSESTFSNITAELGDSDKSSLCGSPQEPLLEEKFTHRAKEPEPKFRMFNPKYSKLRILKRLSNKNCASEQETLLQKSPLPQQCQSF